MLPDLHIDPASIPAGDIPAALSALAALQAALAARLMTLGAPVKIGPENGATMAGDSDAMLTVSEAAARLRRSTKWIYKRCKTLSFARRLGPRSWVFSSAGLERWLARQKPS